MGAFPPYKDIFIPLIGCPQGLRPKMANEPSSTSALSLPGLTEQSMMIFDKQGFT
jgi:hypothetical protein